MSVASDVWTDVHDERKSLLGLLETLTPLEWNMQSLCAEWRVRDVVGHLISETTMSIPKLMVGTVGSGLRINKFISADACRKGSLTEPELIGAFRTAVLTRTHLPWAHVDVDARRHHHPLARYQTPVAPRAPGP